MGCQGQRRVGLPEDAAVFPQAGKRRRYQGRLSRLLMAPYRYGGTRGRIGCRCRRLSTERVWIPGFPDDQDMNHPEATGVGPFPLNNPGGVRMSTALAYLEPCRHRLNLTVRGDVLARRVQFDGKRATGVEVESNGQAFRRGRRGNHREFRGRRFTATAVVVGDRPCGRVAPAGGRRRP